MLLLAAVSRGLTPRYGFTACAACFAFAVSCRWLPPRISAHHAAAASPSPAYITCHRHLRF